MLNKVCSKTKWTSHKFRMFGKKKGLGTLRNVVINLIFCQVGETCQKLHPCASNVLCRETCHHPYYECIHCDKKQTGLHCDKLQGIPTSEISYCINKVFLSDIIERIAGPKRIFEEKFVILVNF